MFSLFILAVFAAAIAGLAVKFLLDRIQSERNITWKEYAIGMMVITLLLAPSVTFLGWKVAKSNNLSFNEYWNGWEKSVAWEVVPCSRDGPCVHVYDCDPYVHIHTRTHTDSDGKTQTENYTETHYHSCPYTSEEWNFGIDTTLGFYSVASHLLPENSQFHRWRASETVPRWVISRAGAGFPEFWTAAKARIDSGKPGPVTKRMTYDNYLLSSDQTILKEYSDTIKEFLSANLLPQVQSGIHNFYYANKVYFVGYAPKDVNAWQRSVMYINGALGAELQGDLHLVITKNQTISRNPDAYILALKAYWSDKKVFGDNTVSKNTIIVVVGTEDGEHVSWSRAITGMPMGNEHMLVALRNELKGLSLMPDLLVGDVRGEFYTEIKEEGRSEKLKVRGVHDGGKIERIFWGLDNPQTKFKRVSMKEFSYLDGEIELKGSQKFWIAFVTFIVCMPVWVALIAIGERSWRKKSAG